MRRSPVVSNFVSIGGSYALFSTVVKVINKNFPIVQDRWWHSDRLNKFEVVRDSLLQQEDNINELISQTLEKIEEKTLSNDNLPVMRKLWTKTQRVNAMMNNINTVILFALLVVLLIAMPIYDWFKSGQTEKKKDDVDAAGADSQEDEIKLSIPEKGEQENNKIEDISHETGRPISTTLLKEEQNTNTFKQPIEPPSFIELENASNDSTDESLQDKDNCDPKQNIKEHNHYQEGNTLAQPLNESQTPDSNADNIFPPASHTTAIKPLALNALSDRSSRHSASSAPLSARIQFSPTKPGNQSTQVDTNNAYSQPFKFK